MPSGAKEGRKEEWREKVGKRRNIDCRRLSLTVYGSGLSRYGWKEGSGVAKGSRADMLGEQMRVSTKVVCGGSELRGKAH